LNRFDSQEIFNDDRDLRDYPAKGGLICFSGGNVDCTEISEVSYIKQVVPSGTLSARCGGPQPPDFI